MALSPEQRKVLAYLKVEPEIPTVLLAQKTSVSKDTIEKWKKEPEFQETLNRPPREMVKQMLFLKAMAGDSAAAREYLKLDDDAEIDDFALALGLTTQDIERISRDNYRYEKAKRAS